MKEGYILKKPLIVLTGPTAVGKTELSIILAKAINGEIISADSMQVYKSMNIGTAKISPTEMQGIPHYLIDELEPEDDFNVVKFKDLAMQSIEKIYNKGKIPIVVGGTGFYIQALLYGIDFQENDIDISYRENLEALGKEKGTHYLHEKLNEIDPQSAQSIHQNNVKKVIRALEYYHQTGNVISEHNEEQKQKESPYLFSYFVLTLDRSVLYQRINQRVDLMMEQGLIMEVKELLHRGLNKQMVSMQGIGYKEMIAYLEGELSLEESVDLLKKNTRHFAKRQLTWFRREKEVTWIEKSQFKNEEIILEELIKELNKKGIL